MRPVDMDLARRAARPRALPRPGCEAEDLAQEAAIGVLLGGQAHNAITNALRRYGLLKRTGAPRPTPLSIDSPAFADGTGSFHEAHASGGPSPLDVAGASVDVERLLAVMRPAERDAVESVYLRDEAPRAVAARRGVTEARISQLVQGGLRRARRYAAAACLIAAAGLTGCAPRTITRVETVEVPVPVAVPCPPPPVAERPPLPISTLHPDATPADVARAYVATVTALLGYVAELEALLDAYRPPAP